MSQPVFKVNPPQACDICRNPFRNDLYNAKTIIGQWGNLCKRCFKDYGVGLGLGRGQQYTKQSDGRWLKVAG